MKKDSLVTGLALFAMFFGAGNLIFPPFLGMESGAFWPLGIACFILIDVIISCLGIYALNAAGGSNEAIEGSLGKVPGIMLNTAAILCTGVLIASPRTAATTFEMSISPIFGDTVALLPFSVVFFAIVFLLSYKESKLVDIIGKILTPLLVLGIGVLIVVGIVNPLGPVGDGSLAGPQVVQEGINAGYQAMDIICLVGYSILVRNTILDEGYTDRKPMLRIIAMSSIIAGVLLSLIYGGLAYVGATAGSVVASPLNQAQLIVRITHDLMGFPGIIILGVVVGLACLTTAIGLTGSTAAYFVRLSKGRLPYAPTVAVILILCLIICNLGLSNIIALASPILSVVCPPFMTAVVLLLFLPHIRSTWTFKGAAIGAVAMSLLLTVHDVTGAMDALTALPLYDYGFAWLPFAALGGIIGALAARVAGNSRKPLPSLLQNTIAKKPQEQS